MPLKIGSRVVGVMNVSYPEARQYSESELRVLRLLGDQADSTMDYRFRRAVIGLVNGDTADLDGAIAGLKIVAR